jgi:hypothetical protein
MGALPILVLNNQMLSPRLGYFFDQRWIDPFESLVSILWKFARANDIAGHVLAASLCADGVDPYEGIPPLREMVKWRWLRREYRIPMRAIRESMVASSRPAVLPAVLEPRLSCDDSAVRWRAEMPDTRRATFIGVPNLWLPDTVAAERTAPRQPLLVPPLPNLAGGQSAAGRAARIDAYGRIGQDHTKAHRDALVLICPAGHSCTITVQDRAESFLY